MRWIGQGSAGASPYHRGGADSQPPSLGSYGAPSPPSLGSFRRRSAMADRMADEGRGRAAREARAGWSTVSSSSRAGGGGRRRILRGLYKHGEESG
jgi:hypothetical protein